MKNPTQQELMELVDGTLPPERQKELELLIESSLLLQKEITLLKAIKSIMHADLTISPSKNFTSKVMKEILSVQQESLVFRLLKNSSNVFAMVLVLSLIAIVLVSSSSPSATNPISQSLDSFSLLYNTTVKQLSIWTAQYTQPLNEASKTMSGKIFFLALVIFTLYVAVDQIFGKKYFHTRMKNN